MINETVKNKTDSEVLSYRVKILIEYISNKKIFEKPKTKERKVIDFFRVSIN